MVIHYCSAVRVDRARRFSVPRIVLLLAELGVSAHYLISRHGGIFRLVPEQHSAWHCGPSVMPSPDLRNRVNDFSIGIELVATDESGFTESQYRSLGNLCTDIAIRRGPRLRFLGHEHVAGAEAVGRGLRNDAKSDPGPLFDWKRLAANVRGLLSGKASGVPMFPEG